MNKKIKTFTDLNTWKERHKLVLMIYQMTRVFPKEERYSLVNQMRRAAISITSNIAEGFSRQSYSEKFNFIRWRKVHFAVCRYHQAPSWWMKRTRKKQGANKTPSLPRFNRGGRAGGCFINRTPKPAFGG